MNIKHLMTGPKGNSEFCFPETQNVPGGETEGNIEGRGEIKLDVSRPISKIEQTKRLAAMTAKKKILDASWHTNLPQLQGARPDHVRVKSSSCCFPRELVSFVRPWDKCGS